MKTFYTAKQINELRTAAQFYKLKAPAVFWTSTADQLKTVCNGAGAESWSHDKRAALTAALRQYEAAIAIHDVDYEWHVVSRKEADKRLKKNMIRTWRKHYGFWRWFKRAGRIERLIVIPAVYAAVAIGGKKAWNEGGSK